MSYGTYFPVEHKRVAFRVNYPRCRLNQKHYTALQVLWSVLLLVGHTSPHAWVFVFKNAALCSKTPHCTAGLAVCTTPRGLYTHSSLGVCVQSNEINQFWDTLILYIPFLITNMHNFRGDLQCFFFQNLIKCFMDTLTHKRFF